MVAPLDSCRRVCGIEGRSGCRDLKSQQTSSDERLLDFSQGVRVQVHVGNGLVDQLTSDGEPLLPGCRCGPFSEAIKDRPLKTETIKD